MIQVDIIRSTSRKCLMDSHDEEPLLVSLSSKKHGPNMMSVPAEYIILLQHYIHVMTLMLH